MGGFWGGAIELKIIADLYNLNIVVSGNLECSIEPKRVTKDFICLYHTGNHYKYCSKCSDAMRSGIVPFMNYLVLLFRNKASKKKYGCLYEYFNGGIHKKRRNIVRNRLGNKRLKSLIRSYGSNLVNRSERTLLSVLRGAYVDCENLDNDEVHASGTQQG